MQYLQSFLKGESANFEFFFESLTLIDSSGGVSNDVMDFRIF